MIQYKNIVMLFFFILLDLIEIIISIFDVVCVRSAICVTHRILAYLQYSKLVTCEFLFQLASFEHSCL